MFLAICALSPSSENSYLAYPSPLLSPHTGFTAPSAAPVSASSPGSSRGGDVLLFDALSLSVTNIVQAHKAPLAFLSLNPSGSLLATASDKGTVIRVFAVPNGDKVAEFRRGTYPAKIYHLAFNAVSTLLGVTSDSDTIHIFKLNKNNNKTGAPTPGSVRRNLTRATSDYDDNTSEANSSIGGYEAFIDARLAKSSSGVGLVFSEASQIYVLSARRLITLDNRGMLRKKSATIGRTFAGSVGQMLPQTVTGMWDPQRDFAYLKLPLSGVRSCVAMSG